MQISDETFVKQTYKYYSYSDNEEDKQVENKTKKNSLSSLVSEAALA